MSDLNSAVFESGARNCRSHDVIYAATDTTSVELYHETLSQELGPIDQYKNHLGIFLHTTLALSSKGVPLGVLDQQQWTRSKETVQRTQKMKKVPISEKESNKWLKAVDNTLEMLERENGSLRPHVIFIGDQESDIYEYFLKIAEMGAGTITRVYHDRKVAVDSDAGMAEAEHAMKLRELVLSQRTSKKITLKVTKNRSRKARTAEVTVRYLSTVKLKAPDYLKEKNPKELRLSAILAVEENPPDDIKKKEVIDWFILTTEPLETMEDAIEILKKYKFRWRIEDFHYLLKSGMRIEELQFETFDRYCKVTILLTEVAFELLRLTYLARVSPELPATEVLTELQIQVLMVKTGIRAGPGEFLSIKEAVRMIGRLGGHLGRKSDGPPGVKTLWRGLRDLQLLVDYAIALRNLEEQD